MKKQIVPIFCIAFALAIGMAACAPSLPESPEAGSPAASGAVQVPNPITEYATIEEAAAAAGFAAALPSALSEGYELVRIAVIAGTNGGGTTPAPRDTAAGGVQSVELGGISDVSGLPGGAGTMGGSGGEKGGATIEITWADGENVIAYRVARGEGADLSGDYTQYANNGSATVGDLSVQTRGNGDKVNVATWSADGFSHALVANPGGEGIPVSEAETIIGGLQ